MNYFYRVLLIISLPLITSIIYPTQNIWDDAIKKYFGHKADSDTVLEIINKKNVQALDFLDTQPIKNLNLVTKIYINSSIKANQLQNLLAALKENQTIGLELRSIQINDKNKIWETISNNAKKLRKITLTNLKKHSKINNWNIVINNPNLRGITIDDDHLEFYSINKLLEAFARNQNNNKINLRLSLEENTNDSWRGAGENIADNTITCIKKLNILDNQILPENLISILKKFDLTTLDRLNLQIGDTKSFIKQLKKETGLIDNLLKIPTLLINELNNHDDILEAFGLQTKERFWQLAISENVLKITENKIDLLDFEEIIDLNHITKIQINNCKIKANQLQNLFAALKENQTIVLELASIQINDKNKVWEIISNYGKNIKEIELITLKSKSKINNWDTLIKNAKKLSSIKIFDSSSNKSHTSSNATSPDYSIKKLLQALAQNHNKNIISLSLSFDNQQDDKWQNIRDSIAENSIRCVKKLTINDPKLTLEDAKHILYKFDFLKLQYLSLDIQDSDENILKDIQEDKKLTAELGKLKTLSINNKFNANGYDNICLKLGIPPQPPHHPLNLQQKINYEKAIKSFLIQKKIREKLPPKMPLPKISLDRHDENSYYNTKTKTINIEPRKLSNKNLCEGILLHELGHAIKDFKFTNGPKFLSKLPKFLEDDEIQADFVSANYCTSAAVASAMSKHFFKYAVNDDVTHTKDDPHPRGRRRAEFFKKAAEQIQGTRGKSLHEYIEEFEQ